MSTSDKETRARELQQDGEEHRIRIVELEKPVGKAPGYMTPVDISTRAKLSSPQWDQGSPGFVGAEGGRVVLGGLPGC